MARWKMGPDKPWLRLSSRGLFDMTAWLRFVLLVGVAPFVLNRSEPGAFSQEVSPAAKRYLEDALHAMRSNSVLSREVNWDQLDAEALSRATGAGKPSDAWPAIAWACRQLHDRDRQCNKLMLPDWATASERASVQAAWQAAAPDPRQELTSVPISPFASRTKPDAALLRTADGKRYALLTLPGSWIGTPYPRSAKDTLSAEHWAAELRLYIIKLNDAHPDGWIVDLRGVDGGDLDAALLGLGPLMGSGVVLDYSNSSGIDTPWFYDNNTVGVQTTDTQGNPHNAATLSLNGPDPFLSDRPVAILFDQGTTHVGEGVAVAFAGRRKERSFGVHTEGWVGCCRRVPLSDGAALAINDGVAHDRNNHPYPEGLSPDVRVDVDHTVSPTDDPAILQAEQWIANVR